MSEPTTHKDPVETECQCGSSPLAMVSWLYSDGEGERCQACGHPGHINVEEQGLEGPVAAWWYADECDEGCRHDELGLMPINLDPGNSAMSRPYSADELAKLRIEVYEATRPDSKRPIQGFHTERLLATIGVDRERIASLEREAVEREDWWNAREQATLSARAASAGVGSLAHDSVAQGASTPPPADDSLIHRAPAVRGAARKGGLRP